MNDRFKFRAWDKKSRKIYNVAELGFNDFGKFEINRICLDVPDSDWLMPSNLDKCILMQCTGLKDKNRKLIYEGDIVKENWHTYVIYYDRGYSIKDVKTKRCYTINAFCNEKAEVIGNIYENPELLENKNADI